MKEEISKNTIEVRGFLHLDAVLRKRQGKMPLIIDLSESTTGRKLAESLDIPIDEIEVIFINGFVEELDHVIHPGDRVAFLPPGCPGPYRIALGFYGKNQDNPANFKIKGKE